MSTPDYDRKLIFDPRVGTTPIALRYRDIHCDGAMGLCPIPPERGPRLAVPPKPYDIALPQAPGMTLLHYCRRHMQEATPHELLDRDRYVKGEIEAFAKAHWPHGTVPDFERARIVWMLVGTPEYRQFLIEVERGRKTVAGIRIL